MYGNPYSKFATLHGMIEAYDFVHQWTSDGGQLTSSDVRLMIDGMAPLRYTSLLEHQISSCATYQNRRATVKIKRPCFSKLKVKPSQVHAHN